MKWRKEMQEFLAAKNKAEAGSDVEEMEDEEELDPEAKAQVLVQYSCGVLTL